MSGLEIWLRVTALVFAAAVIGLLGPAEGIERWLLVSTSLEQLADGLQWRLAAAHLYTLRAYFLFDFLFLLAHGYFFQRLLKGKKPALAMMALDLAENIAALFLIDAVLLGKTGESPWFLLYAAAFYLKWMAVAWTYFACSRLPGEGRVLLARRLALRVAAVAAIVYPVAFRLLPGAVSDWTGYAVAGCLAVVLATTVLAMPHRGVPLRTLFFL